MRRIYGVYGMMEWVGMIPTAGNMVRVRFGGGRPGGYGSQPATFTTDNPALMHLIESSDYFRNKRIRLLKEEPDEPSEADGDEAEASSTGDKPESFSKGEEVCM